MFLTRKLWAARTWSRFSPRVLLHGISWGPRTCLCSLQVRTPIRALMSLPMTICLFGLIALSIESNSKQNCLWCWSSHRKYTDMRVMEINFPLICLLLESNRSNFRLSCISHPEKSSFGSMVIGGRDPANLHASWNSGERMIATPLKRWLPPFAARSALWRKMWYPLLSRLNSSPSSHVSCIRAKHRNSVGTCSQWCIQVWTGQVVHQQ